ncbi:MAG TPA: hypothetical protein VLC47_09355 [Burkholderiales bacterium]|nr:hypothetical protein [Burkholderiales bacterium]
MPNAVSPGRSCPVDYGYAPADFRRAAEIEADTVYAIGGLYGNPFALEAILVLAAAEPAPPALVFNGDFNWFDAAPDEFATLNARVLRHVALRGNVETELAGDDDAAGCGCAYPDWVGDAEVARSNAILATLRETARGFPELRARLGTLPMHAVATVGGERIAIVHGDAWSLAGWEFSQERLREDPARVGAAFAEAGVRVFASSHTCLPVFQPIGLPGGRRLIANNGAAGMPNFRGTRFGLITRISVRPHADALYGERLGPICVDALAVRYDHAGWVERFDARWPEGSPAAASYRRRILEGPAYEPQDAARSAVRPTAAARQIAVA